ncbi:hypothetical protein TorRG33x02_028540 [Trema orientale]|uniref:Arogenate dehydratase n=1 Tax=Trema orientale TaxID=63057 RepID=A0A2P5FUW5_TREOI|nr:hypothetical protein TorRG33x02_028540 [Trema orientale]
MAAAATAAARSAINPPSACVPSKSSSSDRSPRVLTARIPLHFSERRRRAPVLASARARCAGSGRNRLAGGGALELQGVSADAGLDVFSKDVHALPRPLSSTQLSRPVSDGSRLRVAYQIESRPLRNQALRGADDNNNGPKYFDYLFYVDFEASMADQNAQNALRHLHEFATFMRVLGSYPVDTSMP